MRALAAAYAAKPGYRSRWSGVTFVSTATCGRKRSTPSSWKDDSSHTKSRGPGCRQEARERRADVSGERRRAGPPRGEDLGDPGGRRRLSVGPRDGDPAVRCPAPRPRRCATRPRSPRGREAPRRAPAARPGRRAARRATPRATPPRPASRARALRRRSARRAPSSASRPSKSLSGRLSPTATPTPRATSASASARPLRAKPSTATRRGSGSGGGAAGYVIGSALIAASTSRARARRRRARGSRSG